MTAWENEPNHVEFEHAGFPCIIHRNRFGALCGYVGVPETHAAYEKHYEDVTADVHGGLTYAEECQGDICHPGQDKRWWLGFDCAHAGDLVPEFFTNIAREFLEGPLGMGEYRDIPYVRREVESLAEQLRAMA